MDIKCKNCQMEYELDEDVIENRGSEVQCMTCGHLFKVYRTDSLAPEDTAESSHDNVRDADPGQDLPESMRYGQIDRNKIIWISLIIILFVAGAFAVYFSGRVDSSAGKNKAVAKAPVSEPEVEKVNTARVIPDQSRIQEAEPVALEEKVIPAAQPAVQEAVEPVPEPEKEKTPVTAEPVQKGAASAPAKINATPENSEGESAPSDSPDTIADFKKVLEEDPFDREAITGLAYAYMKQGDTGRAITTFRRAVSVSSKYGPALYGLGKALLKSGNKPLAMSYFRKYLASNPSGKHASTVRKKLEEIEEGSTDTEKTLSKPEPEPVKKDKRQPLTVSKKSEESSRTPAYQHTEEEKKLLKIVE